MANQSSEHGPGASVARWGNRLKWLTVLVAVAIGLLAAATLAYPMIVFGPLLLCEFQPDTFEASRWRSGGTDDVCTARSGMVDDLIANGLLEGKTREDVIELLGEPDPYGWGDDSESWVVDCWIDCRWLIVRFNATGQVVETYEAED